MEQFNQLFIGTCTWVFLAKALQSYGFKSANSGGRIGVWRKGSNSVIGSVEIIGCKEFDKASSKATFSKHRIPPSELLACLFFSTHVFRCTYKYIYIYIYNTKMMIHLCNPILQNGPLKHLKAYAIELRLSCQRHCLILCQQVLHS